MPFDSLLPAPLITPLTVKDAPQQVALRAQLLVLNRQIAEQFQSPPTFHSFVQHEFEQAFPTLSPSLDVRHGFIQLPETAPPQAAAEAPPATQVVLLPTLLDAVVQRIVSNRPSTYMSRTVTLLRLPAAGEELQPLNGVTSAGLDKFLDRLAAELTLKYSAFLEAFWARPRSLTDARTQKQWWVHTHTELLKTEVALLAADRLLSPATQEVFAQVLRYPQAEARQALRADRPCVYGVALSGGPASADLTLRGAFVLTAKDPEQTVVRQAQETQPAQVRPVDTSMNLGTVLLFLPTLGLEAFDSLASLDRELHRRLNHPVEFTRFLECMAQTEQPQGLALHRQLKDTGQVVYREWLNDPFNQTVESRCQLMLDNFTSTIIRYQAQGEQDEMNHLPQVLDRVMDPGALFSAAGVLVGREIKRGQAQLRTFLLDALPADKAAWRAAMADYCDVLSNLPDADGLPSLAQYSDRPTLLAYANQQLRIRLKADYELDINPDDILVHTQEPYIPPIVTVPGAPAPAAREPGTPLFQHRSRTLSELALDNVGGLDFNFTHFSRLSENTREKPDDALLPEDFKPAAPYDGLTLQQVKDLVRTVNVGHSYDTFLKDCLITSPGARAQKHRYGQVLLKQLRLDAIEAKINGDFLPDRLARGFNWVQVVLDQPVESDQREHVEGNRILVQHLKLRGNRVRGVLLFCSAAIGVGSIVVYTPQAPGGRVFHEYAKDRLMTDFVMNSSWRDYLLGRVERAFEPQVRAVLKGRGDVSMVSMGRIGNDLFEEAYEVEANFAINDAGAQSKSTQQINVDTGLTVTTVAVDILSMVLPVKIMLPIGLARSLFSVFNAGEALDIGDRAGAAHYFVRSLGELIGALLDGAVGARTPVVSPRPHLLPAEMALRQKPDGVVPLAGWEGKGVYHHAPTAEAAAHYFLNEGARWYSIIDDGDKAAWRLRDARKLTQYHYSPIRQNASGQWEIGAHPFGGLKGGNPPERALMNLYPRLDEFQARQVFESFNFPAGREIEFCLALVQNLRLSLSTVAFEPYLNVSVMRFQWRLAGLDLPDVPVEVPVAVGASRPRPVELQPAPVVPRPIPVTPEVVPVRALNERFIEWGRNIDIAELEVVDTTRGIFRRVAGDQRALGQEYIKMDQRYFTILRRDLAKPNQVMLHDPEQPIMNFVQMEELLRSGIYNQPRQARFASSDGLWVVSSDVSLKKPITTYVRESFALLTTRSQGTLALALFNRVNLRRVTQSGMNSMIRTLRDWQLWLDVPHARLANPFSLLPRTRLTTDHYWYLMSPPGSYSRLDFRSEPVAALLANALAPGADGRLAALMSEVLTRCRYNVLSGYDVPGELLFRRPGDVRMYWLRLRRVVGDRMADDGRFYPYMSLMDEPTRALVAQAQAGNNVVALVGGIHLTTAIASPQIFMIRV